MQLFKKTESSAKLTKEGERAASNRARGISYALDGSVLTLQDDLCFQPAGLDFLVGCFSGHDTHVVCDRLESACHRDHGVQVTPKRRAPELNRAARHDVAGWIRALGSEGNDKRGGANQIGRGGHAGC